MQVRSSLGDAARDTDTRWSVRWRVIRTLGSAATRSLTHSHSLTTEVCLGVPWQPMGQLSARQVPRGRCCAIGSCCTMTCPVTKLRYLGDAGRGVGGRERQPVQGWASRWTRRRQLKQREKIQPKTSAGRTGRRLALPCPVLDSAPMGIWSGLDWPAGGRPLPVSAAAYHGC